MTMKHTSGSATEQGRANEDKMQLRQPERGTGIEVDKETEAKLFRAGEYVAPGAYFEIETGRCLTLVVPGFLPARLEGQVAYYRLAHRGSGETSEQSLVRKQMSFHALVAHSHKRLYHFVRRSLHNPQDAEDLTQEVLARAWSYFETFDPRQPFDAWIFRIARNLIIDQSRRRTRRQEISLDAPVANKEESESVCCPEIANSTADPQNCLMAKELSAGLQFALRSLSTIHRKTLLLVAQQHSYEQIAGVFGCSIGTVRSRVYRARVLAKRNLKESMSYD
jgi:RNA polymerase sigma-70 factor, ECF subfamily